jgi:anaerobic dimethyl sulfoxide reductase subunit C
MNSNDWPLVFFTLLSQLSVGIVVSGMLVFFFTRNQEVAANLELKKLAMSAAIVVMGLALIISFLHLARPLHSVFAFANLRESWLSLEILLVLLFFFLLFMAWISVYFKFPSAGAFNVFYAAAFFAGLILIYAMARIYLIPTVPAWNSPLTFVKFYNSSLLLGATAMLLIATYLNSKGLAMPRLHSMVSILFFISVFAVLIHFIIAVVFSEPVADTNAGFPLPVIPFALKAARMIFLVLGFAMLALWYLGFATTLINEFPGLAYLAFISLFLAEIFGRYIFYASYYRLGV